MATVVYQGSQSCLDNSQLVEARMLRLRLSSPKTHLSQSFELATKATNTIKEEFLHDQKASSNRFDSGGWTFFHALSNHSQGPKEASNKETTYVHPSVKHSSSRLSDRSLEMCTESLGSETGSDAAGNSRLFPYSSSCFKEDESVISSGCEMESEVSERKFRLLSSSASKQKSCQLSGSKKADSRGFPPPLTTMSGSGSLHVRPHREDGRLIMQAIKSPSTRPCFRAERLNGRLLLSLVEESPVSSSSLRETPENIPERIVNKIQETQNQDEADDLKSQAEDGNGGYFEEEMEIRDVDVEAEMGLEDFRRPRRRCTEENKILLNWEPFWVAT